MQALVKGAFNIQEINKGRLLIMRERLILRKFFITSETCSNLELIKVKNGAKFNFRTRYRTKNDEYSYCIFTTKQLIEMNDVVSGSHDDIINLNEEFICNENSAHSIYIRKLEVGEHYSYVEICKYFSGEMYGSVLLDDYGRSRFSRFLKEFIKNSKG